ncbi:MAG TPA: GNAT family N-acetyltransferase [Thermoplasmata archaeon]|nr:GNAT family N-acetyltransferase [Thermoplasmata archaeon]
MADPVERQPARRTDAVTLLELTAGLRKALLARGEILDAGWPEEAVADLRAGRVEGVTLRRGRDVEALGMLSLRPQRGYGHAHVVGADGRVELGRELLEAIAALAPPEVDRIDIGLTGLSPEEEDALVPIIAGRPGFEAIRRLALTRTLELDHPQEVPAIPPGLVLRTPRTLALGALGRLDWEAFRGSPDAEFVADTLEGNQRLIEAIFAGHLGRFLEEASVALADEDGVPAGFVLVVEESPRVGVIVDLAVDPGHRRSGLGRFLLARALRALVALGHARARLWVTDSNAPARALYASMQFAPEARSYVYRWRR